MNTFGWEKLHFDSGEKSPGLPTTEHFFLPIFGFFLVNSSGRNSKVGKKNLFGVRCLKREAFSESGLMEEKGSVGLWRTQSCTPQVLERHAGRHVLRDLEMSTRVLIFRSLLRF